MTTGTPSHILVSFFTSAVMVTAKEKTNMPMDNSTRNQKNRFDDHAITVRDTVGGGTEDVDTTDDAMDIDSAVGTAM